MPDLIAELTAELTISALTDGEVSVTLLEGAPAATAIQVDPLEVTAAPIAIEGPPGPKGEQGDQGEQGPRGLDGYFGEPDVPDLSILFENKLI